MSDFVYTLQRSAGGTPATLRVTNEAIIFTIPDSLTPGEIEAFQGLQALAIALKRQVSITTKPNNAAT